MKIGSRFVRVYIRCYCFCRNIQPFYFFLTDLEKIYTLFLGHGRLLSFVRCFYDSFLRLYYMSYPH